MQYSNLIKFSIGTCSMCGGQVEVPIVWSGVDTPSPRCTKCGAVAVSKSPVIQTEVKEIPSEFLFLKRNNKK